MASVAAAPLFYMYVQSYLTKAVLLVFLVVEIVAFINCLTQKAAAFPVVGSLTKPAWLAILGAAILLPLLCLSTNGIGFIGFIAIAAAALYLLDVRPALRDAAEGSGPW